MVDSEHLSQPHDHTLSKVNHTFGTLDRKFLDFSSD